MKKCRSLKCTIEHTSWLLELLLFPHSLFCYQGSNAVQVKSNNWEQWKIVVTLFVGVCVCVSESCCVGLHPLVCSLIAESHPLHKVIRLVWTATEDARRKDRRKRYDHQKTKCVSRIYFRLIRHCTFHMCKGLGVSSLPLFGGGRGWRSSKTPATHHWDRQKSTSSQKQNTTQKQNWKWWNRPANKVHLIPTEDVQYQPLVRIRELHVLEKDGALISSSVIIINSS